jgi:signal transduction histidine kinase
MIRLLDDVLTIGKAETGSLYFKPSPVNLEQFCLELVRELQPTEGNQHAINFINRCQHTYYQLDEKLLRHILTNLLSNAIKYSQKGSEVKLEIFHKKGRIIFQVEDKGIGIPEQDRQCLFESFYRAANVGNIPGTGLGLAIVKKCVELHSGDYRRQSTRVGTNFTVTLPVSSRLSAFARKSKLSHYAKHKH